MPTTEDLRIVLRELECDRHDLAAILAASTKASHPRLRRRQRAIPAVAAAVVVLLVGSLAYVSRDHIDSRPAAPVGDVNLLDRYLIKVGAVPPGLEFADLGVTTTSQSAALMNSDGAQLVEIQLDRINPPVHYEPNTGATSISVAGEAGYDWTSPTYDGAAKHQDGTIETISWVTGAGITFRVMGPSAPQGPDGRSAQPLTHAQLLAVADSVSADGNRTVRTPLDVGYLPSGYHVVGVSTTPTTPGQTETIVDVVEGSGANVALQIMLGTDITPASTNDRQPITAGAFTGSYSPSAVSTLLSDGQRSIEVYYNAGELGGTGTGTNLPIDEITRIVEGLRFASSSTDSSTWFSAADVLIH